MVHGAWLVLPSSVVRRSFEFEFEFESLEERFEFEFECFALLCGVRFP